jgi:hypothetical protein
MASSGSTRPRRAVCTAFRITAEESDQLGGSPHVAADTICLWKTCIVGSPVDFRRLAQTRSCGRGCRPCRRPAWRRIRRIGDEPRDTQPLGSLSRYLNLITQSFEIIYPESAGPNR